MSIIVILVLATSVWVFFDAPTHDEPRIWALACLLLWIIAFPWYLAVRGRKPQVPQPLEEVPQPLGGRWATDPYDPERIRYHNGERWTQHTAPRG